MAFSDIRRLRAFSLVVDLGSVSAASDVLGYTQSAVSQQVAALEREVGLALLDRSQRPIRATLAGQRLRPQVDRLLAAVADAEATVEEAQEATLRLRVAAFPSALSSFVPGAVRDLRRAHPDLVVRIVQHESAEAVEQLRAGEVDLAVVHHLPGLPIPDTGGLIRRRLLDDDLHVVLPSGHRLARRDVVDIGDLRGEPLVLPRRETPAGRFRSLVEQLCAEAGFAPLVAYELDDLPAAQAFVAAGIAIVPMHGLTLSTLPTGSVARPLVKHDAGSRRVEALAPAAARTPQVDELVSRLVESAAAYTAGKRRARAAT